MRLALHGVYIDLLPVIAVPGFSPTAASNQSRLARFIRLGLLARRAATARIAAILLVAEAVLVPVRVEAEILSICRSFSTG